MNIHFWGVRGSIPTPLTPAQIQAKITVAIQGMQAKDVESDEAKKKYISALPKWIFGTIGGNTPCVEVTAEDGTKLVFDAGTGIRVMGKLGVPQKDFHYNLLFSHFHWDHIQGLPFFDQAYNPNATFDIYSPYEDMKEYLSNQMVSPYYPVTFDAFTKKINFHTIKPYEHFEIGSLKICCVEMSHPGKSYSYRVEEKIPGEKTRSFVYATDVELSQKDFSKNTGKACVFENADILVLDTQYTVEEAFKKENWGHSAFCYAIDFAEAWNIKTVYLFHHEPTYDDRKLDSILESAKWYASYATSANIELHLAIEGQDIKL